MRTAAARWIGLLLVGTLVAACEGEPPRPDPQPTEATVQQDVTLDFLAYGPEKEVEAFRSMVDRFNREHPGVTVRLQAADDEDGAFRRITSEDSPDVFLASRRDLADLAEEGLNQPIDELLDSRGVDFGDSYKRDALLAFSLDSRLQCMPYGVSPMVMYLNTELVDFDQMAARGLPVPTEPARWTFDQFAAAAQYAARRGVKGVKGVHIEPTLLGIAPFVLSGDGQFFDDAADPTTLTLSEDGSREALDRTLQLLRRSRITPSPRELRQQPALARFKSGRLGMIAGFRSLVPELRSTPNLSFDVMPMPTLESEQTVGDVSGLCLSSQPANVSAAADFVVHAISAESVSEVAEAGYLVPANNEVAESDAFLQPEHMPVNAEVFNRSVRDIVNPPLLESWGRLEEAVHDRLYQLFYARVIDIEALTQEIDAASAEVIEPEAPEETEGEEAGDEIGEQESESPAD